MAEEIKTEEAIRKEAIEKITQDLSLLSTQELKDLQKQLESKKAMAAPKTTGPSTADVKASSVLASTERPVPVETSKNNEGLEKLKKLEPIIDKLISAGFLSSDVKDKYMRREKFDFTDFLNLLEVVCVKLDSQQIGKFSDQALFGEVCKFAREQYDMEIIYPTQKARYNGKEFEIVGIDRGYGFDGVTKVSFFGYKIGGVVVQKAGVNMCV